ncbi:MAG: branched-chain amino acid ABC transporter permease [Tepidisphaera sp.]|nr:branched-chain amino acid ABC transporter permease [Tepidisphaera sp.]
MTEKLIQTLMDGLAVGSLYALIALGYTMVYGILKFINFAHSDVFVLGAWMSYTVALCAGWPDGQPTHMATWVLLLLVGIAVAGGLVAGFTYWRRKRIAPAAYTLWLVSGWGWVAVLLVLLARLLHQNGFDIIAGGVILVCSMLTCGVVGFALERLAYKPLRNAPRLNVLITAIGVSLFLQNLGQLDWMFGTRPQGMPQLLPDKVLFNFAGTPGANPGEWLVQPVRVRLLDVIAAGTSIALMVGLDRLVFHSKLGRAMRAVSFSERNAALMGIPVDKVVSFTFVLGAMLAAAAGFLYSQKYPGLGQTAAAVWVLLGLKAFVAAVVGGIGNIRGAMLGGLLIGLAEMFVKAYQSPSVVDIYVFGILIAVLLVRPGGLLGKATVEKV